MPVRKLLIESAKQLMGGVTEIFAKKFVSPGVEMGVRCLVGKPKLSVSKDFPKLFESHLTCADSGQNFIHKQRIFVSKCAQ